MYLKPPGTAGSFPCLPGTEKLTDVAQELKLRPCFLASGPATPLSWEVCVMNEGGVVGKALCERHLTGKCSVTL